MKIEKTKNPIRFEFLYESDVFEDDCLGLCMKMQTITTDDGGEVNCVNLEDGAVSYIDPTMEVSSINCTLLLK